MRGRSVWLIALILLVGLTAQAEQRFPPPDFESGYTQPVQTFQEERRGLWLYLDIAYLLGALGVAAWLVHTRRSRAGLFVLGITSLLYLGFFKQGCVCPIGSIQNITLGLVDSSFIVSIPVIAVFVLPLLFALMYGRVFCGGVCPLGAIQDLFLVRAISVPSWIEGPLGLIRYIYLGLAVFFAAAYSRFVICEYDPFVSFFRFNGPAWRLGLGVAFLAVGLFIARPYCRYLCPYGVLLSWFSRLSTRNVKITPSECINCTLCDATCPFGAIERPTPAAVAEPAVRWTMLACAVAVVVMLPVGGYFALGRVFSGALLGGWFGIVLAGCLVGLMKQRGRRTYRANPGACLSCARCYDWCPQQRAELTQETTHAAS